MMKKPSQMSFDELIKSLGGTSEDVAKARSFEELVELSMVPTDDGSRALDIETFVNAPAVGYNGGLKCDVTSGPCSCGAWH